MDEPSLQPSRALPLLEVLITSGGTVTKIDDVRSIGNFSSGRTGAAIAEEFLDRGAVVHYVHSKGGERPFRRDLVLDPKKPLEEEVVKMAHAYQLYQEHKDRLHEYAFHTFEDYQSIVRELLTTQPLDCAIMAAAVSDYGASPVAGKISSDQDRLTITLERLPKVIAEVKALQPSIYLVGFKLLATGDPAELERVGREHLCNNYANLVVANSLPGPGGMREILLVSPTGTSGPISIDSLPKEIADAVYGKLSK